MRFAKEQHSVETLATQGANQTFHMAILPRRSRGNWPVSYNRFARDLMVQEVGFAMLRNLGISLIAADSPSSFLDDGPTSKLIRQILGAVICR